MPHSVTKYSVFIASPGDVAEEREVAIDVIKRWNDLHTQRSKIVLEPLLWESNTAPDFDRSPQDKINADLLDRADLLVAILWSRIGTPTYRSQSGTLEEIERFRGRKMIYFCQRARQNRPGTEEAAQAAKVDEFRAKHSSRSYCREFEKPEHFQELLLDHLTLWANDLPRVSGPSELVTYDLLSGDPTLLNEWGSAEQDGTVLIYNAELASFQNAFVFQRVWGRLAHQPRIRKVILLLPRYKIQRIKEFLNPIRERIGSLERFHVCPLQLGGVHAAEAPSSIGFAMFVVGADALTGSPYGRSHVFVLAPPFAAPERDVPDGTKVDWSYRHALEIRDLPSFQRDLLNLFVKQYVAESERPLASLLEPEVEPTTIEREIKTAFEDGRRAPEFYRLFEKARLIREKLFDPNVPSYVLDEDFFILDWNPTFEMIFPTERFNRGDFVRQFLTCLSNYEKTLESGKAFMSEHKPLFHDEEFVYESPRYGTMTFTKVTSPVRDSQREILGWNVALNVDAVEHRELFSEDRKACVELDALLTRYAASYDRITSRFSEYEKLVDAHAAVLANAVNVVDLGCGPGVLTSKLLRPGRRVTAIDCNDAMLDQLRGRCGRQIQNGQLRVAKANVEVLNGLDREFDGAVMLNVLYAVRDREACLKRLHQVLIDGAPVVISGPRHDADVEELFAEVARKRPRLSHEENAQWRDDFDIFKEVNFKMQRSGLLHRLSMQELTESLERNGFAVDRARSVDRIYAGQGMLVVAHRRPDSPDASGSST